jgi:hypothetical protein
MKAAGIKEIKEALQDANHAELVECCLRLARFKQESKELLTYLLFEAQDENSYVTHVKESLDILFSEVNKSNLYYAKKTIRKIVRTANKYIRYSGRDITEAEILLHVAEKIKELDLDLAKSPVLMNLYKGVLKKLDKCLDGMHEDLRYDFTRPRTEIEI